MKAIKVSVNDGQIVPEEPIEGGQYAAILVMPDPDPWDRIINDPHPRPALDVAAEEAMEDFLAGRAKPLDPDKML